MTTNDELARWGEPPADRAEQTIAELLAELLNQKRGQQSMPSPPQTRGGPTSPANPNRPEVHRLAEAGDWLDEFVSSVLDWSGLRATNPSSAGPAPVPPNLGLQADGNPFATPASPSRPGPSVTMADRLVRGERLDWPEAFRYGADLADALVALHARGILHRAVCPANVFWDARRDKVTLAEVRRSTPGQGSAVPVPTNFAAPELLAGRTEQLGPATDVYGLGATLYSFWAGQAPFAGASPQEILRQVKRGLATPDPRSIGVPERLELLIRSVLVLDPAQRPGMTAFAESLRGAFNQLLADRLTLTHARNAGQGASGGVQIVLRVQKVLETGELLPVVANIPRTSAGPALRDMRRVPRTPPSVELHTGDRVRVDVAVDREGYVTVLNIGPRGHLNLLYPESPTRPSPLLPAGQALQVSGIQLTPPSGRERVLTIWTQKALPLDQVLRLTGPGNALASPTQATRDLQRTSESLDQQSAGEWHVAVLEMVHLP